MKSVLDIWRTGDDFLARLDAAAEELHAFHLSGRVDPSGLGLILNRIIQVNEELRPWQNRFSTTLGEATRDRKSTRLNSSHLGISYAVFCLKKKNKTT